MQPLPDSSEEEMESIDLDATLPYGDNTTQAEGGDEDSIDSRPFGYTIEFDNVNQKTMVRHSSRTDMNIKQSYRELLQKMKVFEPMKDEVVWHIPHEHTRESNQKSEMLCLGVIDKNEARIADMIDIMEHYQQYVANDGQYRPKPILLYGEGLSCERVNDAENARINAADCLSRLEGLVPAVQEWHKRGVMLQDTYEMLYNRSSAGDKKTLFHIRNTYGHKGVEMFK